MSQFYVPFNDPELIEGAEYANEERAKKGTDNRNVVCIGPSQSRVLSNMEKNDPLLVLAHGRYSTPDQIGGVLKDGKEAYLTASQLATRMVGDGLPLDVSDVRLLVCWAGYTGDTYQAEHTVKRKEGQAPFAGQFSSALKGAGCKRVIVTGYTGEIYLPSRKAGIGLNSVFMDRRGQEGGKKFEAAVGGANQSLFEILDQITKDQGKRATDLKTRTAWL